VPGLGFETAAVTETCVEQGMQGCPLDCCQIYAEVAKTVQPDCSDS
jgi:hypothetical protein